MYPYIANFEQYLVIKMVTVQGANNTMQQNPSALNEDAINRLVIHVVY